MPQRKKLSDDDATSVRKRYRETTVTMRTLADEFGVSQTTISNILKFRTYQDAAITEQRRILDLADKDLQEIGESLQKMAEQVDSNTRKLENQITELENM